MATEEQTTTTPTESSAAAEQATQTALGAAAQESDASGQPGAEGATTGDGGAAADGQQADGENTGGEKAEGSDATAGEGDTDTSLDSYADFELPEGMQLDEATLNEAKPIFKELGLNKEQAQKLVELHAKQIQATQQGQVESFNQLKQDWLDQAKSDKEFGGEKFDESVKTARVALNKFGTPELTQLLNETGVGNHPEVIRLMARVGRLTQEDNPGATGAPSAERKDRASILYPSDS